MSNDKIRTDGTVDVMVFHGKRMIGLGLFQEPLQAFVDDVTRIAQAEGRILEGITLFFADAQPEVNSALAIASAGRDAAPSEQELAHEARLARARRLLADIGHGGKESSEKKRRD